MKTNAAIIAVLTTQIELLESRLQELVRPRREYILLTRVPGIGQILATTILLEIGTIERFAGAGQSETFPPSSMSARNWAYRSAHCSMRFIVTCASIRSVRRAAGGDIPDRHRH